MATAAPESERGRTRTRIAVWLLYLGIPAIVLGLHLLHSVAVAVPRYPYESVSQVGWGLLYAGVIALAAYALGLPEAPGPLRSAWLTSALAGLSGALAISVIQLVLGSRVLPRFTILGTVLLLIPWGAFCAWLAGTTSRRGPAVTSVALIGTPAELGYVTADLAESSEKAARVVAEISPERLASAPGTLADIAGEARPTLLVLSATAIADPRIVEEVAELHESGLRVRTLTEFYAEWIGKMPAGELERSSLLFDIGEVHEENFGRVKRVLDVIGASLMLIPLVVLTPVVWVANLFGNRGPLFYTQERVGKADTVFTMVKFRTMTPTTGPSQWTAPNDPRITPVGRALRATHLDELPQMFNVLRGDLSMVGPRPEQPTYVAELSEKLPYYHLRHMVRPGITGWAQVKYPYGASEQDALEKLQYEFYYLRYQNLRLDGRILARTLRTMVRGSGR